MGTSALAGWMQIEPDGSHRHHLRRIMIRTVILTPSRGRPQRLWEMSETAKFTSYKGQVGVAVALDEDEPMLDDYLKVPDLKHVIGSRKSLSAWTNELAKRVIKSPEPPQYLMSAGDDHFFKSFEWDEKLIQAMSSFNGPGFAYGDDMMNGSGLCTSWLASIEVVKALGYMTLPGCDHMYVDSAIMELGEETGRIVYVPEVVIEHKHFLKDDKLVDKTYEESNTEEQYEKDLKAFRQWRYGPQFYRDCKAILELKY